MESLRHRVRLRKLLMAAKYAFNLIVKIALLINPNSV
ncbi:hypothetical protein Xszus_00739 [Xenorhabdus szentirmaii]|nr:hypothetical protein Xsze_03377 [Xenorhabdus szentirmaii DSM 16338]PHM41062.1 hypothetical protein Xszus_00739 [Xenorhabdus szentirmaii]